MFIVKPSSQVYFCFAGLPLIGLLLIAGCATTPESASDLEGSVRNITFHRTKELSDLAQHAREFGNKLYPQICALLSDENAKPPTSFDVIFKQLKSGNLGEAHVLPNRIYINLPRFTNDLPSFDHFDKVFAHEMSHIAAQYQHWAIPFWDSRSPAQKYWGESVADYARFKVLGTNGWQCPECNSRFPHYTDGYACGGAFLLFVERQFGTNVIRRLITNLRKDTYSAEFFKTATGETLDQLWTEFQNTSAFHPGASEALRIREAIGYKNGKPPRHVMARFQEYVAQHDHSAATNGFQLQFDTKDPPPIGVLIETYIYNTQPAGPAELAVKRLYLNGDLPGFEKGEKGLPIAPSNLDELEVQNFPKEKTVKLHKNGDKSAYLYHMVCPSRETGWQLEWATRVSADGKFTEELPLN